MRKMLVFLVTLFVLAVPVFAQEETEFGPELPEAVEMDFASEEVTQTAEEMPMMTFDAQPTERAVGIKYYTQAKYKCLEGYDIIAAYILQDGEYKSRLFFVWEDVFGQWLKYDYHPMSAETFLSDWETKESNGTTLYVPVVKKDSDGNTVAHKDREGTALDESKIPVLRAEDVSGINYAWKDLSEIPFLKNSTGGYVYASTTVQDMDPTPTVTPTPTPTSTPTEDVDNVKVVNGTIGANAYRIEYTASVKYDGRAHVWSQKRLTTKALKKKVNDVSVNVYRNGVLLAPGDFNVKFKNNTKISGTNGKTPFFRVILKGKALKQEGAALKKVKFAFDIVE